MKGSVPIKVAAKIFGKDPAWVSGWLPIGMATRNGKLITDISEISSDYGRINYYVSPQKLYDLTGYLWEGER